MTMMILINWRGRRWLFASFPASKPACDSLPPPRKCAPSLPPREIVTEGEAA
jgi:hypothetical protein